MAELSQGNKGVVVADHLTRLFPNVFLRVKLRTSRSEVKQFEPRIGG
jgi:hypothetical protein